MKEERRIQEKRVSRPILLAPKQEGDCLFGNSCEKNCARVNGANITERAKNLLKREIDAVLEKLNVINEPPLDIEEFKEKEGLAKKLIFMLEGIAVPMEEGIMHYSSCGRDWEGGIQKMQAFSTKELKELVEEICLEVELTGTYQAVSKTSPPSGMHSVFSLLLARISALQLPEDSRALETLMEEGGIRGTQMIAWMAAEPTIDEKARTAYLVALHRMASCASFSGEEVDIPKKDYRLAAALSRFLPMENILESGSGSYDAEIYHVSVLPEIPKRIDLGRLKAMVTLSTEELFVALFGISQRLHEVCSVPVEEFQEHSVKAQKLQRSLETGIGLLAGEGVKNKELLAQICERKGAELEKAGEEIMLEEQGFLKHLVRAMLDEGKLDKEVAGSVLGMLTSREIELQEQLVKLNFQPAHQLQAE
jgi:hypothetical protein